MAGVEQYGIKCEDTMIDFIPVEEYAFYIWHKKQEKFLGLIDVADIKKPVSKSFESLFIEDGCDMEDMIKCLTQRNWSNIYVLLGGEESELLSFCKLPLFFKQNLEDAIFFKSEEEVKSYFKNSESYLPKAICAYNVQYWKDFYDEIHKERIGNVGVERGNIFLSICIPTWNRGTSALNAVKHILASSYDAEIEVVVSNNGSDKTEGYDELKEIKDSRLKYFEFDSNQGFACNFRTVLGMAGGMFAVTCSDEDLLCLDELPKYMDFLLNNMDVRFLTTSGVGPNFRDSESCIFLSEIEANVHAINANYITGATYNIRYMRENKIFETYDEMSGLEFIYWYAQCVMAAIVTKGGKAGFSNVKLWNEGGTDEEIGMLKYMRLENRIKQQNDAVEFCSILYDDTEMFLSMMLERMYKTYLLLKVGFYYLPKEFMNVYKWTDVCLSIYESHLELLRKYSDKAEAYLERLKENIFNDFSEYILSNPAKAYQTEQENLIQEKVSLAMQQKIRQGILPDDISTKELEDTIKAGL
ncbi:MAG: glycosyltransferase family 2 protein [Muribaculaceae bacterium]|nr:glycosyltransferase family 2 protein [Muribaculaceae bacterium]